MRKKHSTGALLAAPMVDTEVAIILTTEMTTWSKKLKTKLSWFAKYIQKLVEEDSMWRDKLYSSTSCECKKNYVDLAYDFSTATNWRLVIYVEIMKVTCNFWHGQSIFLFLFLFLHFYFSCLARWLDWVTTKFRLMAIGYLFILRLDFKMYFPP